MLDLDDGYQVDAGPVSELVGAALVALLSLVTLVRVGSGHPPHGQTFSWDIFALPHGTDPGTSRALRCSASLPSPISKVPPPSAARPAPAR